MERRDLVRPMTGTVPKPDYGEALTRAAQRIHKEAEELRMLKRPIADVIHQAQADGLDRAEKILREEFEGAK